MLFQNVMQIFLQQYWKHITLYFTYLRNYPVLFSCRFGFGVQHHEIYICAKNIAAKTCSRNQQRAYRKWNTEIILILIKMILKCFIRTANMHIKLRFLLNAHRCNIRKANNYSNSILSSIGEIQNLHTFTKKKSYWSSRT